MAEIENLNQEQEEQSINFRDILSMCIANWMWILLSYVDRNDALNATTGGFYGKQSV